MHRAGRARRLRSISANRRQWRATARCRRQRGTGSRRASWSAEGRQLVFWRSDPDVTRSGLWLLDTVSRVTRPVAPRSGGQYDGQLSPDGRWLAYLGQQGDQFVAFVTSTEAAGPKYPDLHGRGVGTRLGTWTSGNFLSFRQPNDRVRVHAGKHFDADRPVVLFSGEFVGASTTSPGFVHYDVSPDAQRFVMIRRSPTSLPHLNVIRGFSISGMLLCGNANLWRQHRSASDWLPRSAGGRTFVLWWTCRRTSSSPMPTIPARRSSACSGAADTGSSYECRTGGHVSRGHPRVAEAENRRQPDVVARQVHAAAQAVTVGVRSTGGHCPEGAQR